MLENNILLKESEYDEYTRYIKLHNTWMDEKDDEYIPGLHPFLDYIYEDKSRYPRANTKYEDTDDDFLIGESGGILMDISFKFINTHLYRQVAIDYEKNILKGYEGKEAYAGCREGTEQYRLFWLRETERRKHGMTAPCKLKNGQITNIRITGDHYHYLNYSRINRVPNKEEYDVAITKGLLKGGKIPAFPGFWDGDYWNFKLDEFIAKNGFNLAKAKARRKGFSFKRGSQSANTLNLYKGVTVIFLAYDLGYLTDEKATAYMAKKNLDWIEDKTHWTRGFSSEDLAEISLGYKKKTTGSKKYGWGSSLLSFGCRTNTSAGVGKDAIEIDFEESGAFPNIQEVTDVTKSSTEQGGMQIGTMRWYGTAGTKGANWAGFMNIFYKPRANRAVPLENIWDKNSRMETCGFFFPQIWCYEPFLDRDGNSLLMKAFKYDQYDKWIHEVETVDLESHLMYVGQRANSPEEAFNVGKDNIFNSPELQSHVNTVKNNSSYRFFRDGQLVVDEQDGLVFRTNAEIIKQDKSLYHPYIEQVPFNPKNDIQGCIREWHKPFKIDGSVPDNLYAIVYDPVGKDKNLKEVTTKNSLNAIYVVMLPNTVANSSGDIIVASYVGRKNTMEEADRICYYLSLYYNAKVFVEVDRGDTVKNFKIWKALHKLYRDPRSAINGKENNNAGFGMVIGNDKEGDNAIIYLKDWLYESSSRNDENNLLRIFNYIYDLELLQELRMYHKLGNFDRISSLRLYPYIRNFHAVTKRSAKSNTNVSENKKSLLAEIYT